MHESLATIKLERSKVLHQQIREQVRELIVSCKLRPAERLPSTQELAATFEANVGTVHTALVQLVKEGVLLRHAHKGTFVRQREEKLTRIGIDLFDNDSAHDPSPFARSVAQRVQVILHEQGIEPERPG